jgi:PAS domain S-box-containing protein
MAGQVVTPVYETVLRHKNGSSVDVEVNSGIITYEGKPADLVLVRDITERKRMEEKLRGEKQLFRALAEQSSDIIVLANREKAVTYENQAVERALGLKAGERIGVNLFERVHPDDLKFATDTFNTLFSDKNATITQSEIRLLHKDGSWRTFEVAGSNLARDTGIENVIINLHDITERKQVESQREAALEALRESEALYHLLAEHVTDIVWMMDMDLNVTWLSPSATKARGFSVDEIVALPLDRQLTPKSLGKALNWLEKLMRLEKDGLISEPDGILSRELEFYCKDGRTIVLDCTFQFIRDGQGKATGILAEGMDITARKRAEEKLLLTLESLRKAFGTTIKIMVSAVEMRDPYTSGHQIRSADLARAIATEMGLPQDKIDGIRLTGSIHDIGKLSIPAEILSKPSKLTNIEFSLIKEHSRVGYEMLKDVESPWPLAQIVYQHHERIDGSGYPRNLKGDEILIEARIMAVADVVEAMASHRPYRPALGIEAALEEIKKNKGILYDDAAADACLRLFQKKNYQFPS